MAEHPFVYLGHGVAAARKTMQLTVCFRDPVPKAARATIEEGVPSPIAGVRKWGKQALLVGNDNG